MSDYLLTPSAKPRRTIVKHLEAQNTIRVFSSPEDVIFQIRRTNDIFQINLLFDEAKKIAEALLAAAESGK